MQQYVNATTRNRQLSSEHVVGHTGRYPALGAQFEKELSDHAKRLSELFFGIRLLKNSCANWHTSSLGRMDYSTHLIKINELL